MNPNQTGDEMGGLIALVEYAKEQGQNGVEEDISAPRHLL
jgi:hypothetical protein